MGREGTKKSKPSRGNAAELFDSVELRVHRTPEMRQASDGILELTGSTGESAEFALALNSTGAPSSSKGGKGDSIQQTPARQSRAPPRHGSTTPAMTVSTPVASPSKKTKKEKKHPKSSRTSNVQRNTVIEPSSTPASTKNDSTDDGPANLSIPSLHSERGSDDGGRPDDFSSPRKNANGGSAALSTSDSSEANGGCRGAVVLSPGAYSVRPGASNSVVDESESTLDDDEDSTPLSASRSVDASSAAHSEADPSAAGSADTATTTVTATAVTRDDLEQEVRERILREAVVAEVMVTPVEPNPSLAPSPPEPTTRSPATVPDGFFTHRPSVPDGFFTSNDRSVDSQSRVSFLLPEAPLEDKKSARERNNGTGCCVACSPCCYKWRWWLIGLISLLLVMGALGVVFGVVLPAQNNQNNSNTANQPSPLGNNIGGLRRTAAPSPQLILNPIAPTQAPAVPSLTLEPNVGSDTTTTQQPAPAVSATSAPLPTMSPYPQPTPTSSMPWTADTLLQFLMDNTINGGMGLTLNGTPAKNAYDAIVGSSIFTGVPLNGQMVDVFTLMCFYLLTNGATAWTNHEGWGEKPNPCEWYGVTCNSDGRVAMLLLPSNGIRGGLSMEMNNIKDQLTSLDLSGNQLMFDKANLSQLYRLQHLNLSQASVYGDIDSLLGSTLTFPFLQVVDVGSNYLMGPIPTGFGAMTQLRKFLLPSNQFTGSIPTELAQLSNLNVAKFEGNGLSGSVPDGLCQLKASNSTSSLKMLSVDCAEVSCSCCTCF